MNLIRDWLGRVINKQGPTRSWADQRRNEALELLAHVGNERTWTDLSRHSNGFVREVAVRELCSHPSPDALIALIERLNDWVPQVRNLAASGLQYYLTPSQAQALLAALEPLMNLAACRRVDHGATLSAARVVLQSPSIRDEVYKNFLARQGKAARYLFALLLEVEPAPEALLCSALAHRELTVRLMAITACGTLPVAQAQPLLLEALSRRGVSVRVRALHALLPLLDDPRQVVREALLDESPSIRHLAHWAASRHEIDALNVLTERLNQELPVMKRDWLGVLGLAGDLNVGIVQEWHTEALRSAYSSVRHAAVKLLRDDQLPEMFEALDDPSEKIFVAALDQLNKQPWARVKDRLDTKLNKNWHGLSLPRRAALFQVRPRWQQLAYLLERLEAEPDAPAYWLRQVDLWCDRQYQIVDPVTPKAERDALLNRLRELAARGLIRSESLARVA